MANRLKVPGTLQTRAAIEPSTFDAEKGTVEVCWTTGARGKRNSWDGPYFEELEVSVKAVDLSRMNNGASVLNSHSSFDVRDVIGVVERAWIAGNEGRAKVRFSDREDVKPIRADVANGILRHISVGYAVQKYEQVEKVEDVPVYRATKWTPMELSIVPIAFDDGARVRGRSEAEFHEVELETSAVPAAQERKIMAEEIKPETPAADATDALVVEARQANARASAEADKIRREAADKAAAEATERITETQRLVARTRLGDAFAQKLIKAQTPLDKVREIVLNELARSDEESAHGGSHLGIEAGDDKLDKFRRAATAAVISKLGMKSTVARAMETEYGKEHLAGTDLDGGEFRKMRMEDIARHGLELRGVSTRGLYGEDLIKRAFQYRSDAGMNTTSDFTNLLENVVNKVFLGQYALAPTTWRSWCGVKPLNDFRATTFYRPGTFGLLQTVTEQGEVKHLNVPDGAKATITPGTKGAIVGISRRMLVNDDLGAFRDSAAGLGLSAAETLEYDAYLMLTTASGVGANAPDGTALFTAGHGNIGTTGAMSVATLDSMRAKMALQKDASSNYYLALRPAVLVVPVEIEGTAKVFNNSSADPTDYKNANVANKVNGLFREIVSSPYLSAQSSTRVYAFADPGLAPVCVVGFINGQEAPKFESQEMFGYDGAQIRVLFDYGTAVIDTKGAVTCAGQ